MIIALGRRGLLVPPLCKAVVRIQSKALVGAFASHGESKGAVNPPGGAREADDPTVEASIAIGVEVDDPPPGRDASARASSSPECISSRQR